MFEQIIFGTLGIIGYSVSLYLEIDGVHQNKNSVGVY